MRGPAEGVVAGAGDGRGPGTGTVRAGFPGDRAAMGRPESPGGGQAVQSRMILPLRAVDASSKAAWNSVWE